MKQLKELITGDKLYSPTENGEILEHVINIFKLYPKYVYIETDTITIQTYNFGDTYVSINYREVDDNGVDRYVSRTAYTTIEEAKKYLPHLIENKREILRRNVEKAKKELELAETELNEFNKTINKNPDLDSNLKTPVFEKYLAFDGVNIEYVDFETIEEAREWLEEAFLEEGEYHPDLKECKIYKLEEVVDYDVIDKKSNYKYDIRHIVEGDVTKNDVWPYDPLLNEIWEHKFVKFLD